jgi:hypothetical protein
VIVYLTEYAEQIRREVPAALLPAGDTDELFRAYAVLLLAKGSQVSLADVHNAWAAWMAGRDPDHPALIEFDRLPPRTAQLDRPFLEAIHRVAAAGAAGAGLDAHLFPRGVPTSEADRKQTFELYKIMVASSEALVARRQGANSFFLTINGALLTAIGLIVGQRGDQHWQAAGLLVLTLTGLTISQAWVSLIRSFRHLNAGKFAVINRLEQLFPAAVFLAEWKTVEEGRGTMRYRTFTSREIWVPYLTSAIYCLATVADLLVLTNLWSPR